MLSLMLRLMLRVPEPPVAEPTIRFNLAESAIAADVFQDSSNSVSLSLGAKSKPMAFLSTHNTHSSTLQASLSFPLELPAALAGGLRQDLSSSSQIPWALLGDVHE